jgi:hypothetical protein
MYNFSTYRVSLNKIPCLNSSVAKQRLLFNTAFSKVAKITKEVCQGCLFSPTHFNMYLNEIIIKLQKEDITGISHSPKIKQLLTLLSADDQVTISST